MKLLVIAVVLVACTDKPAPAPVAAAPPTLVREIWDGKSRLVHVSPAFSIADPGVDYTLRVRPKNAPADMPMYPLWNQTAKTMFMISVEPRGVPSAEILAAYAVSVAGGIAKSLDTHGKDPTPQLVAHDSTWTATRRSVMDVVKIGDELVHIGAYALDGYTVSVMVAGDDPAGIAAVSTLTY